jgi:hypothetical protein
LPSGKAGSDTETLWLFAASGCRTHTPFSVPAFVRSRHHRRRLITLTPHRHPLPTFICPNHISISHTPICIYETPHAPRKSQKAPHASLHTTLFSLFAILRQSLLSYFSPFLRSILSFLNQASHIIGCVYSNSVYRHAKGSTPTSKQHSPTPSIRRWYIRPRKHPTSLRLFE